MSNYDATGGEQGWTMKSKLNELRLDAGIARIENQQWLCVLDKETGMMIDPLIGLEKFAELIVKECINEIAYIGKANEVFGDRTDRGGLNHILWTTETAIEKIREHFGVEE
jgi:hypothetical protein